MADHQQPDQRQPDHLLSIGQFARLCRLTVKQLRNYDDGGLLAPAVVDPATGYRWYRLEQARPALTIALLRGLDVPLAEIARALDGDAADVLQAARRRTEEELARRGQLLHTLDRLLTDGFPEVDAGLVELEPQPVVVVRTRVPLEEVGVAAPRLAGELVAAVIAAGLPPPAGLIGIFPLDLAQPVDVVMAAEVPDMHGLRPGLRDAAGWRPATEGVRPDLGAPPRSGSGLRDATHGPPASGGVRPDLGAPPRSGSGLRDATHGPPASGGVRPDLGAPPRSGAAAFPAAVAGAHREVLPGGLFARAAHRGPYAQMPLTAHGLLVWCGDRGHLPAGELREVYHADPQVTAPHDLTGDVLVRLGDRPDS